MTTNSLRSFALLGIFLLCAALAGAQTFTTLSLAATSTDKVVTVASATGISAPGNAIGVGPGNPQTASGQTVLVVDGEAMEVLGFGASSTQIQVRRGAQGTAAKSHLAAAKVAVCTRRQYFDSVAAKSGFEAQGIGAAIASASSITVSNPTTHVTGTTTVNTIVVPSAFAIWGGTITLIPDGAWSTGTSGNIAVATTGVVSQALRMSYDPVAAKWYPSYK